MYTFGAVRRVAIIRRALFCVSRKSTTLRDLAVAEHRLRF
jgi:hypothetical protein